MRNIAMTILLAAGCASTTPPPAPPPAPEPSPATGFRAAEQTEPVETWQPLGTPVEVLPTQHTLVVNGKGGKISTLLLKGVSGEAEIEEVTVEFLDDRASTTFRVQKKLMPGDAQVVELREGRAISKIVVFVDPDTKGQFTIEGA